MNSGDWFKKYDIRIGDVVDFSGLRMTVKHLMSYGGVVCTGGEVFPAASPLWDTATVEGKETVFVDPISPDPEEEERDNANWWKK